MKILVILGSGIGNSILFSPTLSAIRKTYSNAQIDLLAYKPAFAAPFTDSGLVDNMVTFRGLSTVWMLRREHYDVSITAFPSNKWQFNVFAFLVGAKRRITHSYTIRRVATLSFLQNEKVPSEESLHDVDQNLRLLKTLEISPPERSRVLFHISDDHVQFCKDYIKEHHLQGKHLIGVHPGSGPLAYKRAPVETFIKAIERHATENSVALIFGTPDELAIKELFPELLHVRTVLVDASLGNVAALIKECDLFITNDTGLMHIASTSPKTRIIAFFNGTNPTRTRPYTDKAEVVVLRENVLRYPFSSTVAGET